MDRLPRWIGILRFLRPPLDGTPDAIFADHHSNPRHTLHVRTSLEEALPFSGLTLPRRAKCARSKQSTSAPETVGTVRREGDRVNFTMSRAPPTSAPRSRTSTRDDHVDHDFDGPACSAALEGDPREFLGGGRGVPSCVETTSSPDGVRRKLSRPNANGNHFLHASSNPRQMMQKHGCAVNTRVPMPSTLPGSMRAASCIMNPLRPSSGPSHPRFPSENKGGRVWVHASCRSIDPSPRTTRVPGRPHGLETLNPGPSPGGCPIDDAIARRASVVEPDGASGAGNRPEQNRWHEETREMKKKYDIGGSGGSRVED